MLGVKEYLKIKDSDNKKDIELINKCKELYPLHYQYLLSISNLYK